MISAVDLTFYLPWSLKSLSFPVNFQGWGNDFMGSLIISSQTILTKGISIEFPNQTITCTKQLHWYYYNAARGNMLLPISNSANTKIEWIQVSWGLFTACGRWTQLYDIIGYVQYTYNEGDMGRVYFGVDINESNNTSNGNYNEGEIQRKVTNGINGRFFDTMYGVGKVTSIGNITGIGDLSNLLGLFTNIYVQGQAGIGNSVNTEEREILSVNLAGTKTILTSNDEANSSKVISVVNQNVKKRCPDSATYSATALEGIQLRPSTNNSKIICIDNENNLNPFIIDRDRLEEFKNKDIVIKWGNVFLDHSIYNETNSTKYLSLYVPDGYLIFDSTIDSSSLRDIDKNGFLANNGNGITQGIYLEGNFIVNGLILWASDPNNLTTITTIPIKTYIHGKIISLNTLTSVSGQRDKHLSALLWDRNPSYGSLIDTPNFYYPENVWNASLGDLFSWQCSDTANDGAGGGTALGIEDWLFSSDTIETIESIDCPVGHRYPLMIIDKQIPSLFFN